jgi:hypothetical protein
MALAFFLLLLLSWFRLQVWRFIKQLMRDLLRHGFPSSIEEDQRLLATAPASYRLRCAVGLRLGRFVLLLFLVWSMYWR